MSEIYISTVTLLCLCCSVAVALPDSRVTLQCWLINPKMRLLLVVITCDASLYVGGINYLALAANSWPLINNLPGTVAHAI